MSNRTSEDAETSEQPDGAKDIKTIVAMQQNNVERLQFLETELRKASKRKDPKQDMKLEYKFSKCWNEEQSEFNKPIYNKLEQATEESDEAERVSLLKEGMAKINGRNKILTVTDCYGWETAQAYLADPIASDSEDEKKLKRARKEAKANKEEKGELLSQNEGKILAASGHFMVQMPGAVSQPVTTASHPHVGTAGGQGTSPAVAGQLSQHSHCQLGPLLDHPKHSNSACHRLKIVWMTIFH